MLTRSCRQKSNPPAREGRRGNIIVLSVFFMVVMMAVLALSIDVGYIYTVDAELRRAVDSAALAGASALVDGVDEAEAKTVEYLMRNPVGKASTVGFDENLYESQKAAFLAAHEEDLDVSYGHWNSETRSFSESESTPSALQVSMRYGDMPLFFGRVLGRDSFSVEASAVAMFQPRDIMVVLDLSGSMNDDSEFNAASSLGQDAVEDNLQQMYGDLESPVYGSLEFEPKYAVVHGAPQNNGSYRPHIEIEYRRDEVKITSTHDLGTIWLKFSNGNYQQFTDASGNVEVVSGSGYNSGKRITGVWVRSWGNHNDYGTYGEYFDLYDIDDVIEEAFGLDNVSYPYSSGSWGSFIDWAQSSNNQNANAGYRYKFGYMNWLVYMLEQKEAANESEDLWKTSAQPITALKEAMDLFMSEVAAVDTNDRVGLAVYNAYDGNGKIESTLTEDLDAVMQLAVQKQAGHYHNYTNIAAGMKSARLELDSEARAGAFKMIVLMTDGQANWHNGNYSTSAAEQEVLNEAYAAAAKKYPIITVSLGAGADSELMQQVADITEGEHFNVPGGQPVAEYTAELLEVFRAIAAKRPLQLVQ